MPRKMKKQPEGTRQKAFIFWVTCDSTRRNEFFGEGNIFAARGLSVHTVHPAHMIPFQLKYLDVRRGETCSLCFSYCKNTDTSAIFKLIHMAVVFERLCLCLVRSAHHVVQRCTLDPIWFMALWPWELVSLSERRMLLRLVAIEFIYDKWKYIRSIASYKTTHSRLVFKQQVSWEGGEVVQ